MAGVTFLAFGNGSPDVFSTFAAMSTNSGSLAVGELFGAAGFITAVVSGSMALIRPFHVARKSFIRDVGFFVVAAAFSMVFLWDGRLDIWECVAMVLFYVFYVAFVVVWHWWFGRRRRRREKEAAARGHFAPPGDELEIEEGEYRDDPDEEGARPTMSRMQSGVLREDWSALERGGETYQEDEDEEEEARDRWMSELNSNMRLTRGPVRSRRNTLTPVRPSLVGALEFQAVLKSLQKSRNIQTYPMNTRRYSDDPTYTTAQQQDQMSSRSDPASRPPFQIALHDDSTPTMERPSLDVPVPAPARTRAVSANDAEGLRIRDLDLQRLTPIQSVDESQEQEILVDLSGGSEGQSQSRGHSHRQSRGSDTLEVPRSGRERGLGPPSPSVEISPATPRSTSPINKTVVGAAPASQSSLAPPQEGSSYFPQVGDHHQDGSPRAVPNAHRLPKIVIPGRERSRSRASTPSSSPFLRYRDEPSSIHSSRPPSIFLPTPSIASPESLPASQSAEQEDSQPKRPTLLSRWWPHRFLPPPGLMISMLFPTIYHWHEKNYWEKALGVVAAPSVFLLTITLPVVESGKDGDDDEGSGGMQKDNSFDSMRSRSTAGLKNHSLPGAHHHGSLATQGAAGHGTSATVATNAEQHRHNYGENVMAQQRPSIAIEQQEILASPVAERTEQQQQLSFGPPELWNRWLLIIQLFLAPLFMVMAIYSQSPTSMPPSWLIKPILVCLLVSLVLLIPLLLTTTPTHKPAPYRYVLSLVGFVVSIAWISTIASQVVGALKALAVILNMSHAIMGLTIFAVGNSLGDFVADVTVARLGYPVMALSACFGGPMLNILLGIGLSGSYILVRKAQHRVDKHPDKDFKFKSYHIDVSETLIVSGATLLVTLVGLLVAVPMNKWVLSRKIGWALIALWTVSTVGNVVLEVTGWGWSGSED